MKNRHRFICHSSAAVLACGLILGLALTLTVNASESLLPPNWDPVLAGDQVLARLVCITAPKVKGAHDAEMAIVEGHAYIVAAAQGFTKPAKDFGLYLFDSFKVFDGQTYVAINNFPGKQNALARVHDDFATFEILGHYNKPQTEKLSESAVNRLPDGTWLAICRNDGGNYHFTTSQDGKTWTAGQELPFVPNGANSKPTFDKFGDTYYLGWQERTHIHGVSRSVFNLEVSRDGKTWERKYRFETTKSFQYPTFHESDGDIWLCVTQGDSSPSRKERIMFGKLERGQAREGE